MKLLPFYRKLDLYKRIYALNYAEDYSYLGDMDIKTNRISRLTTNLNHHNRYLKISDYHLALATFSKQWLSRIFTKALVELLASDKTILLNAKCLNKLSQHLTLSEIDYIKKYKTKNNYTNIPELMLSYNLEFDTLLVVLQVIFFSNSHRLLKSYMLNRLDAKRFSWILSQKKLPVDTILLEQSVYKASQKIIPMTMRIIAHEDSKS
jgi:hypothetical protein